MDWTAHQLNGIRMKIARANQHIKALEREVDIFLEPHTESQIVNYRFDGTWHIVSINPMVEGSMPLLCSVICGDAIHNLRSALDHLVWQLVLTEGNKPDRWNLFPIYTDPDDFDRFVRFPKKPERSPLHGIAPEGGAWELIEGEQPYNSWEPSEHHLTILAKLSNVDKHRTLHASWFYPSEDSIRAAVGWNPGTRLLEYRRIPGPVPRKRETEVLRLRFSATGPDPQVHVKGKISLQPTFGDGETFQFTLGGIKQMPVWIAEFVEKFVRCF